MVFLNIKHTKKKALKQIIITLFEIPPKFSDKISQLLLKSCHINFSNMGTNAYVTNSRKEFHLDYKIHFNLYRKKLHHGNFRRQEFYVGNTSKKFKRSNNCKLQENSNCRINWHDYLG